MLYLRCTLIAFLVLGSVGCGDDSSSSDASIPSGDGDTGDGDGGGDGDGDTGDGDEDAGDADGGDVMGDGDGDFPGAECGAREPDGAFVEVQIAPDGMTPPESTGGTIQSGTYDLVELTYFEPGPNCVTPQSVRDTMIVTATSASRGTATEGFVYSYGDFAEIFAVSYTYSTDGTESTWNVDCPEPPSTSKQGYSVDGDQLVLLVPRIADCDASVWTYQRR